MITLTSVLAPTMAPLHGFARAYNQRMKINLIRPGLAIDPISVDYTRDQSQDKDRFNLPPLTDKSVAPDVTSTPPSSDSRFPPIKVRDFAYEPYDGPRGYYAPYHNLESAVIGAVTGINGSRTRTNKNA